MTPEIFDAHFHIIDPRFPLVANQGYLPPAYPVAAYRKEAGLLGVTGGALVSGSFQAFDQSYLLTALAELGPAFVGVTQLPPEVGDREIEALDRAGVRALRFNLQRGGSAGLADLEHLARRVQDLVGWHSEFYLDSRVLPDLADRLRKLPQIVVDHLGLSEAGLPALLGLVEAGAKVKASGFGRVDMNLATVLPRIAAANPGALLFGSDLPSTRAPRPFDPADIDLLRRVLSPEQAAAALGGNARALYRPRGQTDSSRA
ncbi:MAG: amidohydrolase family protein [Rhodospirillales bacterium]